MPSSRGKINIDVVFGSDTTQAEAGIKRLQASLSSLQNMSNKNILGNNFSEEISKANVELAKFQGILQSSFNESTNKLDLTKFKNSLDASGMSLRTIQQQFSAFGVEGQKAFANLTNTIMDAEIPLKKNNQLIDKFVETLKNTARWMIASNLLNSITGTFQHAFSYAEDLNKSLNDIRIVTSKSKDEMTAFAVQANKAAKTLSSTTNEYTKASLIYFQQGLSDAEVKRRTDATVKMANVTGESVQQMSDELTSVWNNFMEAGDTNYEHYLDIMTKLGAETASSSKEISEGLQKFSGIAKTVGLSFEVASAALTTVTDRTRQSADVVGNSFKTLFARIEGLKLGETLEDGTDLNKYSQALATVGIQIKDEMGNMKDADTILQEVGNRWKDLARDQQMALAQTVGGVRQYNNFVSLMDNFDFFKENLQRARTAEGSLQEQADIYAESWEAAQKRVKAAAEQIYDQLINDDFFIKITDFGSDILSFVSGLVKGLGGVPGVLSTILNIVIAIASQSKVISSNATASMGLFASKGQKQKVATDLKQEAIDLGSNFTVTGTEISGQTALELAKQRNTLQSKYMAIESKLTDEAKIQAQYILKAQQASHDAIQKKAEELDKTKQETKELKDQLELLAEKEAVQQKIPARGLSKTLSGYKSTLTNALGKKEGLSQDSAENLWAKLTEATNLTGQDFKIGQQDIEGVVEGKAESIKKVREALDEATNSLKAFIGAAEQFPDEFMGAISTYESSLLNINQADAALESFTDDLQNYKDISAGINETDKENVEVKERLAQADKQREISTKSLQAALQKAGISENESNKLIKAAINGDEQAIAKIKVLIAEQREHAHTVLESNEAYQQLINSNSKIIPILKKLEDGTRLTAEEIEELNRAIVQSGEASEHAGRQMSKMPQKTATWKEGLMSLGQGITAFTSLVSSIKGAIDVLNDTDMTFGEKLLSLTTTSAMVITQLVMAMNMLNITKLKEAAIDAGQIANKTLLNILTATEGKGVLGLALAHFQNTGAIVAETGATLTLEAALSALLIFILPIVAAIGALVAIVYGVVKAFEAWKKSTPEGQIKSLSEAIEDLTNHLEEATSASEELKDSISSYEDAKKTFDELAKSAENYAESLNKVNESAKEIIEKNNLISGKDYHYGANGEIIFNEGVLSGLQANADLRVARTQAAINGLSIAQQKTIINKNLTDKAAGIGDDYDINRLYLGATGTYKFEEIVLQALTEHYKTNSTLTNEDINNIAKNIFDSNSGILKKAYPGDNDAYGYADFDPNTDKANLDDITTYLKVIVDKSESFAKDQAQLEKELNEDLLNGFGDLFKNGTEMQQRAVANYVKKINPELFEEYQTTLDKAKNNSLTNEDINKFVPDEDFATNEDLYKFYGKQVLGINDITTQADYKVKSGKVFWESNSEGISTEQIRKELYSWLSQEDFIENNEQLLNQYADVFNNISDHASSGLENAINAAFGSGTSDISSYLSTLSETELEALQNNTELKNYLHDSKLDEFNDSIKNYEFDKKAFKESQDALVKSSAATYAEQTGLDANEIEEYANQLRLVEKGLENDAEAAVKTAIAVMRLNRGVEEIQKNYEDWIDVLNNSTNKSQEWAAAMGAMRSAVADLLNIDKKYVSQDILKEHLDWVQQAAEGSEEAILNLQSALSQQLALDIGEENGTLTNELKSQIEEVTEFLKAQQLDLDIGMNINDDQMIEKLNQIVSAVGMTVEQAQAYFNALGYEPEFDTVEDETTTQIPIIRTYTRAVGENEIDMGAGNGKKWTTITETKSEVIGYDEAIETTQTPQITNKGVSKSTPKIKSVKKISTPSMGNYSTSNKGGSSGSGGGSDNRASKKLSDVQERYHDIDQTIADMQHNMSMYAKAADQAFGKAKIQILDKQIAQQKELNKAIKSNLDAAQSQLKLDRDTLAAIGGKFNEYGQVSNYEALTKLWYDQYQSGAITEDTLNQYLERFNQYEETRRKTQELEEQLFDGETEAKNLELQKIQYSVEYKIELSEDSLKEIEFELENLSDSAYEAAESIALIGKAITEVKKQSDINTSGIQQALGFSDEQMAKFMAGDFSFLPEDYTLTQGQVDALREYQDANRESSEQIKKYWEDAQSALSGIFDKITEDIERGISTQQAYQNILKNYDNIAGLLGEAGLGNFASVRTQISTASKNIAFRNVASAKYEKDFAERQLQDAEKTKDELYQAYLNAPAGTEAYAKALYEKAENNVKELSVEADKAKEAVIASVNEAGEAAQQAFESAREEVKKTFESIFSGSDRTFDELQDLLNKYSEQRQEYLETYEKEYELNKLIRNIDKELSGNGQLKSNQRLLDLKQKIQDAAASTAKMSQVELEMLQKQYDVEVARLALEETRNAKDRVTLVQGSEGNMYYAYSADLDKVDQATQNYEDALKAQKDSIFEWREKLNSTLISLVNIIEDNSGRYSDEYKKWAQSRYLDLLQQSNVLDNTVSGLSPLDQIGLSWKDSTLGQLLPDEASFSGYIESLSTATNGFMDSVNNSFGIFQDEMRKVAEEAGLALDDLEKSMTETITNIDTASSELAESQRQEFGKGGKAWTAVKDTETEFDKIKVQLFGTDGKGGIYFTSMAANKMLNDALETLLTTLSKKGGVVDQAQTLAKSTSSIAQDVDKIVSSTSGGSEPANTGNVVPPPETPPKEPQEEILPSTLGKKSATSWTYYIGDPEHFILGSDKKTKYFKLYNKKGLSGDFYIKESQFNEIKKLSTPQGGYYYVPEGWNIFYPITKTPSGSSGGGARRTAMTMATGGYTGEWGPEGKWALLHQKELVLNADDTKRMLLMTQIARSVAQQVDLTAKYGLSTAGLVPYRTSSSTTLHNMEQTVTIHAEFPGVTDSVEIKQALDNLMNTASHYANRK